MTHDAGDNPKMRKSQAKKVDPAVSSAIGKQLKRMYHQVAQEPVPDRFTQLLDQLAKQEQEKK